MNKKLACLLLVWGLIPFCISILYDTVQVGSCLLAQKTSPESTEKAPGFWDQLQTVLNKKVPVANHRESVTDKYDLYYDWIHREETKLYDSLSKIGVVNWDQYQNILTVDIKRTSDSTLPNQLAPNIKVFGWYPYWMGTAYKSFQFNLLSYVAWFSYNVDPATGRYNNPDVIQQWKQSADLIERAHQKGCQVLLTITNHSEEGNRTFLRNQESQRVLIDSLISLLKVRNGDGVDVNFEMVPDGLEAEMTEFLQQLSRRLKGANSRYIITVDLPVYDHLNTYELARLNPFIDLFLVTGYDYHNVRSKVDGPVAPLDVTSGSYSIKQSVNQYLQRGLNRDKMILGLPYYGAIWTSKSPGPGQTDTTLRFDRHITYRALKARYCKEKPGYDLERWSGYYIVSIPDSNQYEKCWFDDSLTLGRKMDWILQENLAGVGLWALGYDNGSAEFWNLLQTKFASDTLLVYKEPIIESRTYRLSRSLLAFRSLIFIAGIFIVVFLVAGLVVSLFDWRVRQIFFQNKTLRLLYALSGMAIMLSIFAFYLYVEEKPLLDNNNMLALGIGLLLGVCLTLVVNYFYERKMINLP